ncbi:uncharacterized protein LOC128198752 [Bicyclus anynana]|uniref:Uncharacterized protein LOC128198752 n=1 Tax=Bicyclus anynana TaxID=110368 RepID=A0ABM3LR15_BICAN|nr:uncharacterized protein LOC128198752 [Bicyclus anynana]
MTTQPSTKLGDAAKYNLVVAKLGKDVIQQVTDILIAPPEEQRYDKLKEKLLAIYEESENRQIQKLMGEMELGDQRPSHLLRKMQDLARNKINDETLSVLWQNLLPVAVRGVLAATDTNDLARLAKIADKVMENMRPQPLAEIATKSTNSDNTAILAEIAKLTDRVEQLSRHRSESRDRGFHGGFRGGFRGGPRGGFRGRYRGRSHSRRRDSTTSDPDNPSQLCWYHEQFKSRANKCSQPCNWKKPSEN